MRILISLLTGLLYSCTNPGVDKPEVLPAVQDLVRVDTSSSVNQLPDKPYTPFTQLQGKWRMTKKYKADGTPIRTRSEVILLIKDSLIVKLDNAVEVSADTLFRLHYYDSVSEYYCRNNHRMGVRFDGRHPARFTVLFALGDGGGEDYEKAD